MRDFFEGVVGAALVMGAATLIAYLEFRWQERSKPSNAILRHVEAIILDRFNRRS